MKSYDVSAFALSYDMTGRSLKVLSSKRQYLVGQA